MVVFSKHQKHVFQLERLKLVNYISTCSYRYFFVFYTFYFRYNLYFSSINTLLSHHHHHNPHFAKNTMSYPLCFKNSFVFPFLNPLSRTRLHNLSQILSKDMFSTQKLKIMKPSSNADVTPFTPYISLRSSMVFAFDKDDVLSPFRNDCMMRCHRGSNAFEGLLFSFKVFARIRRIPQALYPKTSDGSFLLIRRISL